MPDLSTYTDQRLMQYMAFCTEQSFNYRDGHPEGPLVLPPRGPPHRAPHGHAHAGGRLMARVLVIESGDDWQAFEVPADWDTDDLDRYLNGRAYGRAAVVPVEQLADDDDPDSFLPVGGGEYGGGSM
jgi:hypothetical protein